MSITDASVVFLFTQQPRIFFRPSWVTVDGRSHPSAAGAEPHKSRSKSRPWSNQSPKTSQKGNGPVQAPPSQKLSLDYCTLSYVPVMVGIPCRIYHQAHNSNFVPALTYRATVAWNQREDELDNLDFDYPTSSDRYQHVPNCLLCTRNCTAPDLPLATSSKLTLYHR